MQIIKDHKESAQGKAFHEGNKSATKNEVHKSEFKEDESDTYSSYIASKLQVFYSPDKPVTFISDSDSNSVNNGSERDAIKCSSFKESELDMSPTLMPKINNLKLGRNKSGFAKARRPSMSSSLS